MATVKSPTVFKYKSDPSKSVEQNMVDMFSHMKQVIGNSGEGFEVTLELEAQDMGAAEAEALLSQAMEDAVELEKIKPHSLDTDGEVLYKKQ
jgi:hypothetical protein